VVATTRLSSQSRRGTTRSQERRRGHFGFWTICQDGRRRSCRYIQPIDASLVRRSPKDIVTICEDRPPRSAKDIQPIGASLLLRWRKDIATSCENWPRRSAKDIQSFGADVARQLSKSVEINRSASPQRSRKATSQLFSNPWRPNTQARPRNIPPNATTVTRTRALSHLLGESQSQWWRDTIIWPFGLRNSAMTSR
jgi:hypothetical protein